MDYRARWYDPRLGRFIQADTVVPGAGNPQALNRYAYVVNNPLRYTDPSGHCPWCITIGVGAIIGAGLSYGVQVAVNISQNGLNVQAFTDVNWAQVGAGAVAGAVGGATFGLGTAVLGTGLAGTVGAGAISGAAAGQAAVATENVLSGREVTEGLGDPAQMTTDAVAGGIFAGMGYGIKEVAQSLGHATCGRVVFSGHGEYVIGSGMTTVPEGTWVVTYSKIGGGITDRLGNAIEIGDIPEGVYTKIWNPGQRIPNYTLYPPVGLHVVGDPITTQSPTLLSSLLRPNMGEVHWAACTSCEGVLWSGQLWDVDGVLYEHLPK